MALVEYAGAASLEYDGKEIEVTKIGVKTVTGRRPVKTMNRDRRAKGFSRGIQTYDLTVTAVIPLTGAPDWENIEGGKITVEPVGGGQRYSYLDCFSTEVGEQYQDEGEAVIDIQITALRKVKE